MARKSVKLPASQRLRGFDQRIGAAEEALDAPADHLVEEGRPLADIGSGFLGVLRGEVMKDGIAGLGGFGPEVGDDKPEECAGGECDDGDGGEGGEGSGEAPALEDLGYGVDDVGDGEGGEDGDDGDPADDVDKEEAGDGEEKGGDPAEPPERRAVFDGEWQGARWCGETRHRSTKLDAVGAGFCKQFPVGRHRDSLYAEALEEVCLSNAAPGSGGAAKGCCGPGTQQRNCFRTASDSSDRGRSALVRRQVLESSGRLGSLEATNRRSSPGSAAPPARTHTVAGAAASAQKRRQGAASLLRRGRPFVEPEGRQGFPRYAAIARGRVPHRGRT